MVSKKLGFRFIQIWVQILDSGIYSCDPENELVPIHIRLL